MISRNRACHLNVIEQRRRIAFKCLWNSPVKMKKLQERQFAALPIYTTPQGSVEVCLITARGSGRWMIPKGKPIRGLTPPQVAAQEALEEAGLLGRMEPQLFGAFELPKSRGKRHIVRLIDVYVLQVERQLSQWAERSERLFLCCSLETALSLVSTPGLAEIIRHYARQAGGLKLPG